MGDAVRSDNTTEGDPEGTVTSKDGKTRITNFEAHWVGTDEDTVLGTILNGGYRTYNGSEMGRVEHQNNTKLQVKYVISGERLYSPGMIKIKLPYKSRAKCYPESYIEASNIPMPKAKIIDGKIDYNADYGKAEYIYYIDGDDLIITNTTTIPAATSGTFLIDYPFLDISAFDNKYKMVPQDVRDMPDMYKFGIPSKININIDNENIHKDGKTLYHQVDKKISGEVFKEVIELNSNSNTKSDEATIYTKSAGGSKFYPDAGQYKYINEWNDNWSDDFKPINHEDYYYMAYDIRALVGSTYSNAKLKIDDILGENEGQTIIAYQFPKQDEDNGERYSLDPKQFKSFKKIKEEETVFTFNKISPIGYFGGNFSNVKHMIVLVAFKKDILLDKKEHRFTNTGKITIEQLNSDDKPQIYENSAKINVKYVPLPPKAEFIAPPGNKFDFEKYIESSHPYNKYRLDKDIIRPKDRKEKIKLAEDRSTSGGFSWRLSGVVEALSETYDPKFGGKDNLDAYKRKTYKAELVDDYLYTGNDYKRELTSEDYEINGVCLKISDYDYKRISRTKIGYVSGSSRDEDNNYISGVDLYGKEGITYPSKIYGRKESTGKWEEIASFDLLKTSGDDGKFLNFKSSYNIPKPKYGSYNKMQIPEGFTSIKWEVETNRPKIVMNMGIVGTLKSSDYINSMFKQNETSPGNSKLRIRNDGTLRVINNDGQTIGIPSTTKRDENNSRTLDLDLENYGQEMYHDTAYWDLTLKTPENSTFEQYLTKSIDNKAIKNDTSKKIFTIPTVIKFREKVNKNNGTLLREYNDGIFYDLLPIGVSGINNLQIYDTYADGDNKIYYKDKDKNKADYYFDRTYSYEKYVGCFALNSSYQLIENWQNTGRTLLIAKYDNAELVVPDNLKEDQESYLKSASAGLTLSYDMIYPWDSYKDYGGNLYNFVAFESGKESMESGLPDVPNFKEETEHHKIANEALKDLNKDNDNKNFLYAMDKTIVSGNTAANTGLTKHIKDSKDPKYSLATKTREGGQYSYRIRMQSLSGTTTSNLIFYDSIENYNPLKTDEDYGVKRWKGTLESIDLTQAKIKGVDPKVYITTLKGLNMQENRDITNTNIWKPYKEGDDLSKVQAIAIDLSKKTDGTDFKLKEEESINVTLIMRAPWDMKNKRIDKEAKALNEIYANTTITTDLDNKSTNKLINTAYTAIELEPVETEIQLQANKKHLDQEGKEITLKGDDFTFELRDKDDKLLQTKTNDKDGKITFDPIKYNTWNVGNHQYKIVEKKGNSDTTAYDNHEEVVNVKIERSGDSELKATTTYDEDGANFTNREIDPVKAIIKAQKVYYGESGQKEKPKAKTFEFILKDSEGKEISKATNDAEGNIVFKEMTFTANQLGKHKYTIEEKQGKDPKIEYDKHKEDVTVTVSMTEDYKLQAKVDYTNKDGAIFTNKVKTQLKYLPETGSTIQIFLIGAAILFVIAASIIIIKRKLKVRE